MSGQLHLLRPFTRWTWKGKRLTTAAEAEAYVTEIRDYGFEYFYTATSRWPRRHEELKGGSVYFVRLGEALFRMPFIEMRDDPEEAQKYGGCFMIIMEPRVIRVSSRPRVGFCRGWRYATSKNVPPDLLRGHPARASAALDEIGFVK